MTPSDPVVQAAANLMAQRLASVRQIRNFMFEDLDKSIKLQDIPRDADPTQNYGAPNFMLALVLCCYTEFWGRLVEGSAQKEPSKCFKTFFRRLGRNYEALLNAGTNIYGDIRCGLAHSYVVSKTLCIATRGGSCGIEYGNGKYTFNVERYASDFKTAVDTYLSRLAAGTENYESFLSAMTGKAMLL